ncbi:hypothetical protein [Pseudomonas sp. dw_358]|uniref:hypothetical protein n=1 Tax=Pseudomonas sp. dw_358 TaxID=2720083 RepID=UPI001BD3425A|nr:hypothetical protein [Pseudomonas sp. dw_358]
MQVTVKELMASPRAWLKLWNCRTDRYHGWFTVVRCAVLLGFAGLIQSLFFQLNMPSLQDMQSTRAHTQLVRSMNPHLFTLQVRVNEHLYPVDGACGGYRHDQSNFSGHEDVRVWQAAGKVYQLTTLAGEIYRANSEAAPCTLENGLEWAERRAELSAWLAFAGLLVALFAAWRISALFEYDESREAGAEA